MAVRRQNMECVYRESIQPYPRHCICIVDAVWTIGSIVSLISLATHPTFSIVGHDLMKSKKENRQCNDPPCDVAVIISDKIRI